MDYNIIISNQAQSDIIIVLDYLIENWSIYEASKFQKILDNIIKKLKINPEMFVVHNKESNIFKVPVTKHNMMYFKLNTEKKEVSIITVFNIFQNPDKVKTSKVSR